MFEGGCKSSPSIKGASSPCEIKFPIWLFPDADTPYLNVYAKLFRIFEKNRLLYNVKYYFLPLKSILKPCLKNYGKK